MDRPVVGGELERALEVGVAELFVAGAEQVHRETPLGPGELELGVGSAAAILDLVVAHRGHTVAHPRPQRVVVGLGSDSTTSTLKTCTGTTTMATALSMVPNRAR